MKNKIIVLAGPTGVGKTEQALAVAGTLQTAIISADSRQMFIGADIGTNKIPSDTHIVEKGQGYWKIDGTTVHLYDVVLPDEEYSVARFVEDGVSLCESMWEVGAIPIVVGGTGFYIDALLGYRSFSSVPQDHIRRQERQNLTSAQVFELLQNIDSSFAARLPRQVTYNKQRLLRYLELAEATGSVEAATRWSLIKGHVNVLYIGLTADLLYFYRKADEWVERIFTDGLENEVIDLLKKGYKDTALMQGMIYQPMVEYIEGIASKEDTLKKIKKQMRAYIKRQLTWFTAHEEIVWFDIQQPSSSQEMAGLIESFIKKEPYVS